MRLIGEHFGRKNQLRQKSRLQKRHNQHHKKKQMLRKFKMNLIS